MSANCRSVTLCNWHYSVDWLNDSSPTKRKWFNIVSLLLFQLANCNIVEICHCHKIQHQNWWFLRYSLYPPMLSTNEIFLLFTGNFCCLKNMYNVQPLLSYNCYSYVWTSLTTTNQFSQAAEILAAKVFWEGLVGNGVHPKLWKNENI